MGRRLVSTLLILSLVIIATAVPALAGGKDEEKSPNLGSGGVALLPSTSGSSTGQGGTTVDPAIDPRDSDNPGKGLTPTEYQDLVIAVGKIQAWPPGMTPTQLTTAWNNLSATARSILVDRYGLTKETAQFVQLRPYYHMITVSGNKHPVKKRAYQADPRSLESASVVYKDVTRTRTDYVEEIETLYAPVCGGCVGGVSTWSGGRGIPPPVGNGCCTMVPSGTRVNTVPVTVAYTVSVPSHVVAKTTAVLPYKAYKDRAETYQVTVTKTGTETLYSPVCGGCVGGVSTWSGGRGIPPPVGNGCCTMVPSGTRTYTYTEQEDRVRMVPDFEIEFPRYHPNPGDRNSDGHVDRSDKVAGTYTSNTVDADGNARFEMSEEGQFISQPPAATDFGAFQSQLNGTGWDQ